MILENLKTGLSKARWLLPVMLIIAGAGAVTVAIAADFLGMGSGGFGAKQICLIAVGFAMLLMGIFVSTRSGRRYLHARQASIAADTTPASILLIAVWFGLLTGWGETLVWFVREFFQGQLIFMSIDFLWMVPLANLSLLIFLGLVLSLLNWRWPKLISLRTATAILAFTSFLGLALVPYSLQTYAAGLLAAGLAVQAARITAKHPDAFHRLVRYTTGWPVFLRRSSSRAEAQGNGQVASTDFQPSRRQFVIGAGAAILGMAVGVRGYKRFAEELALTALPTAKQNVPNVLLIVLDTVRAQSLSLYGHHRQTSPQMERVSRAGVCFERAIAPSPWTLPSHGSMFTGRYPHELSADWSTPLDDTYPTLAEVLAGQGYVTAGFAANTGYCGPEFGLSRGFAHYEAYPISPGQVVLSSSLGRNITSIDSWRNLVGYHELLNRKTAEDVNGDFLRWLARQDRRPFFAFLNYFDAHTPYLPPPPFDEMFGPKRPRGDFEHSPVKVMRKDQWKMSPEEIQVELDAYEGAIAYLDHQLGLLFGELEKRGLLENTLVIITSDHGEEFGEHGVFDHAHSLYLAGLRVPLLVSLPSHIPAGKRVREPVSLRDLPATVLDLLEIEGVAPFPGESLARYWGVSSDIARPAPGIILSQVQKDPSEQPSWYPTMQGAMRSLVFENVHYIKNCGNGREEVYDFEKDPWEEQDLAGSEAAPPILESLRTALEAVLGDS